MLSMLWTVYVAKDESGHFLRVVGPGQSAIERTSDIQDFIIFFVSAEGIEGAVEKARQEAKRRGIEDLAI